MELLPGNGVMLMMLRNMILYRFFSAGYVRIVWRYRLRQTVRMRLSRYAGRGLPFIPIFPQKNASCPFYRIRPGGGSPLPRNRANFAAPDFSFVDEFLRTAI